MDIFEITDNENDVVNEDIYSYKIIKNVVKVTPSFNKWTMETNQIYPYHDSSYYFIIDTLLHDAFAHWVFESAIYLPLLLLLKEKYYPNLKLYISGKKIYKSLFFDFFQIKETDVTCEFNLENSCIFPIPISSLNIKSITESYVKQVERFINLLYSNTVSSSKTINTIFLPRQTKEVYLPNNRVYNTTNISEIISLDEKNYILNTDDIKKIKDQIILVNSIKNVILMGVSSYFVNGIFCQDSKIIILDDFSSQTEEFVKLKYIHEKICKNNKVFIIPNNNQNCFFYNDIKDYLE